MFREVKLYQVLSPVLIAAVLCSCGDDPEKVNKRKLQDAQIADLNAQIESLQLKLQNAPPDKSAELNKALAEQKKLEEEIADFEKQIADLDARKRDLAQDLEAYKKKYSVPN